MWFVLRHTLFTVKLTGTQNMVSSALHVSTDYFVASGTRFKVQLYTPMQVWFNMVNLYTY